MAGIVRWRRVVVAGSLLALLAAGMILLPLVRFEPGWELSWHNDASRPGALGDAEQAAILRVLLRSRVGPQTHPPSGPAIARRVWLAGRPLTVCPAQGADRSRPCRAAGLGDALFAEDRGAEAIAREFRRELIAANRVELRQPDPMLPGVIYLRDSTGVVQFAPGPDGSRPPGGARGDTMVRTSRAVRSADGKRVLIYLEYRCGGLCGQGSLYELERRDGNWIVIATDPIRIS